MSVAIQAEANESQSECISPKVNKLDVASLSQLKSPVVRSIVMRHCITTQAT